MTLAEHTLIAQAYIDLQEQLLIESRVDFIKGQYEKGGINTSHDKNAGLKDPSAIVDHFSNEADPTKKKVYTQWIVGQYHKSGMSDDELAKRKLTKGQPIYQEDAPKIHGILSNFDKFKHKLPEKDINKYASLSDVSDAVDPLVEKVDHHTVSEEPHPGRELKYEDPNIKIYRLKTKKASQELYGGGSENGKTDWCTAYKTDRNNMFDNYKETGNLHVVHDKKAGKVFQYHAHDNQFMDAEDRTIGSEDMKRIAPSLHRAWEQDHSLVT